MRRALPQLRLDRGQARPGRAQLLLEARGQLGEPVAPQHHVLRGLGHRPAVGRLEDVVARDHEQPGFQLRLERQRHVHRHLVAVEIGVEGGADQRMDPDGLALHQHRLERLDAQAVQRRGAVEQDRVILDDFLQDFVHLGAFPLHDLLGPLDRLGDALLHQLVDDEGFEEFHGHGLGQAALVQPQLRAHHDDRTARVVHPLAEQVLAEAALLALEHVAQGLERALAAAADGLGAAAVVEQGVHRLLQHALFVAQDDFGRLVLDQLLQPVIAVDHPAVQVVQVAGREAAAIERHQRPEVRRNHRNHVQDHPARGVGHIALVARGQERVDDLEPLKGLLLPVLAGLARHRVAQLARQLLDLEAVEQLTDGGGADVRLEGAVPLLLGLGLEGQELVLVEQLIGLDVLLARIEDDVRRVVDDALQLPQGHVEQVAHRTRQGLEEPDVRHRHAELDVAHALTPDLAQGDFHAAAVADHATVADPLVLAAVALPVLDRTEDPLAEQAVLLGLEGAVVDGLGLGDLAPRPPGALALEFQALPLLGVPGPTDLLGRGDADADVIETRALGLAAAPEINHRILPYSSPSAVVPRVTFKPSAWSSFTSTLNDSGMPGSGRF